MDMWKYPIGTVVLQKQKMLVRPKPLWGHVIGFEQNHSEHPETILLVRWETGEEFAIHHGNVYVKEDFDDQ